MRQEPKLFSAGTAAPQQQDGFHVEPRRQPAADHDDDDDRPSRRGGFPWRLLIGIVVLAVIGIAVWQGAGMLSGGGENAGGVPVFQASVDPFKHRPDDPGGMDVPNQNVTVYDTLDAEESNDGMEQLLPEPEEPIAIVEETAEVDDGVIDVGNTPTAEVQEPEAGADAIFTADQVSELVDQALTQTQGDIPVPQEKPAVPASALAAADTSTGDGDAVAQTDTGNGLSFADVAAALDGNAAAVPQTSEPAQADTVEETVTATVDPAVEAPVAGSGSYWVQIAAYSTREAAAAAWERLARSNADLLGSTSPRVMETTVAGTTLHRLQVGEFASEAQAQSLCDDLQKRTGDQCMIVGP
mgnify:CR=1 FL=1|jgi:cell division protein FtsN